MGDLITFAQAFADKEPDRRRDFPPVKPARPFSEYLKEASNENAATGRATPDTLAKSDSGFMA